MREVASGSWPVARRDGCGHSSRKYLKRQMGRSKNTRVCIIPSEARNLGVDSKSMARFLASLEIT
jgi:hypothetical protein